MYEEWKPIEGYEGVYSVSDHGNVYSHRKKRNIRIRKTSAGYCQVELWKDGKPKWFTIHRLVAKAFIPNPDNLEMVNHKDENPLNNNVYNLEWCTRSYNLTYGSCRYKMRRAKLGIKLGPRNKNVV